MGEQGLQGGEGAGSLQVWGIQTSEVTKLKPCYEAVNSLADPWPRVRSPAGELFPQCPRLLTSSVRNSPGRSQLWAGPPSPHQKWPQAGQGDRPGGRVTCARFCPAHPGRAARTDINVLFHWKSLWIRQSPFFSTWKSYQLLHSYAFKRWRFFHGRQHSPVTISVRVLPTHCGSVWCSSSPTPSALVTQRPPQGS